MYYVQANGLFTNTNTDISGFFIGIGSSGNFVDLSANNVNIPFIRYNLQNWSISGYYSPPDSNENLQLRILARIPSATTTLTVYITNLNSQFVDYLPPIQV